MDTRDLILRDIQGNSPHETWALRFRRLEQFPEYQQANDAGKEAFIRHYIGAEPLESNPATDPYEAQFEAGMEEAKAGFFDTLGYLANKYSPTKPFRDYALQESLEHREKAAGAGEPQNYAQSLVRSAPYSILNAGVTLGASISTAVATGGNALATIAAGTTVSMGLDSASEAGSTFHRITQKDSPVWQALYESGLRGDELREAVYEVADNAADNTALLNVPLNVIAGFVQASLPFTKAFKATPKFKKAFWVVAGEAATEGLFQEPAQTIISNNSVREAFRELDIPEEQWPHVAEGLSEAVSHGLGLGAIFSAGPIATAYVTNKIKKRKSGEHDSDETATEKIQRQLEDSEDHVPGNAQIINKERQTEALHAIKKGTGDTPIIDNYPSVHWKDPDGKTWHFDDIGGAFINSWHEKYKAEIDLKEQKAEKEAERAREREELQMELPEIRAEDPEYQRKRQEAIQGQADQSAGRNFDQVFQALTEDAEAKKRIQEIREQSLLEEQMGGDDRKSFEAHRELVQPNQQRLLESDREPTIIVPPQQRLGHEQRNFPVEESGLPVEIFEEIQDTLALIKQKNPNATDEALQKLGARLQDVALSDTKTYQSSINGIKGIFAETESAQASEPTGGVAKYNGKRDEKRAREFAFYLDKNKNKRENPPGLQEEGLQSERVEPVTPLIPDVKEAKPLKRKKKPLIKRKSVAEPHYTEGQQEMLEVFQTGGWDHVTRHERLSDGVMHVEGAKGGENIDIYLDKEGIPLDDYQTNITPPPIDKKPLIRIKQKSSGVEKPIVDRTETFEPTKKDEPKSRYLKLAHQVYESLREGKLTRKNLQKMSDDHFEGTQAERKYERKEMDDALEMGVNLYVLSENHQFPKDPVEAVKFIKKKIIEQIPVQGNRDKKQIANQQFSTPPHLGYVAAWAANIKSNDTITEPSAGTGSLAVLAKIFNPDGIHVNEIDDRRAMILEELGFKDLTKEDAEQLNNVEALKEKSPSVIVMNPPFSAAGKRGVPNSNKNGVRHLEQALEKLEDNGRLVAIMGKGMSDKSVPFRKWWDEIKQKYNVRANVGVSGKNYYKYGTSFDNRLIIIDKTGKTEKPVVTGNVENVEELVPLLEEIRNDRAQKSTRDNRSQQTPTQSTRLETSGESGGSSIDGEFVHTGATGSGDRSIRTKKTVQSREKSKSGEGQSSDDVQFPTKKSNPNTAESSRGSGRADDLRGRTGADEFEGNEQRTIGELSEQNEPARVESKKRPKKLTDSIFEDYTPKKLHIRGARAHMEQLVESAAMSAVELPDIDPSFKLALPSSVITEGKLTAPQLETVVYAGMAHEKILPNGERKGFFLGDGTGVGKGRQISAVIWDNWRKGRKRAVWISEKASLFHDAKRDFSKKNGIGWDENVLFNFERIKITDEIDRNDGVLFTTYDTLKSERYEDKGKKSLLSSRVDQIVEWLGEDFDGVIAFDESHAMGNSTEQSGSRGSKPPSKRALAGMALQQRLPKARVMYVSATGATEVSNLAYAERLGLWGLGTAFSNKKDFIGSIETDGIAAMEIIARDLKSTGSYLARSLSYDGVGYSTLEHPLTAEQTEMYDTLSEAWQIILNNIHDISVSSGMVKNSRARSQAYSMFWSSHQRFFNQLITALQLPSVIKAIEKDIEDGHSVVIQLVNTNEANQEKAKQNLENDQTLEDLDLTPREMVMGYLKENFPTTAYEEYIDSNGHKKTRVALDSKGRAIQDANAVKARDKMLKMIGAMDFPENPIDQIINRFHPDNVAEITGRKSRIIKGHIHPKTGEREAYEERMTKSSKESDADKFMNDEKRILIFSDAGGTGRSYHADNRVKNKRLRKHYVIQPGWRADKTVQGMGRTHRTNQAQPPIYILVTTDLKGQKRFISTVARRLHQLGALTKGQRQAGSQGLFNASDNMESTEASQALRELFHNLHSGAIEMEGFTFNELSDALGYSVVDEFGNKRSTLVPVNRVEPPEMSQFLNRVLSLKKDQQGKIFNLFEETHDVIVRNAIENGTLDIGIENIKGDSVRVINREIVYQHESAMPTERVTLQVEKPASVTNFNELPSSNFIRYVKNNKSGKVWAVYHAPNRTSPHTGGIVRMNSLRSVSSRITKQEHDDWFKNAETIKKNEARKLWNQEINESPSVVMHEHNILVGTLLPIWDKIVGAGRVLQAVTDDGERFLGRAIKNPNHLSQTLKNLGVGATTSISPKDVANVVLNGGKIELDNGWAIKRATVSGEKRIEVKNVKLSDHEHKLEPLGVFDEIIASRTRYFIPTSQAENITSELFKYNKPVDVIQGKGGSEEPLFSRSLPKYKGFKSRKLPIERIEKIVNDFQENQKSIPIEIVQSAADLPFQAESDTEGAFYQGKVYVVADNIPSSKRLQQVLAHETFGHAQPEKIGGQKYQQLLDEIVRARPLDVNRVMKQLKLKDKQTAAKELIAQIAENPKAFSPSLLQRVYQAVRNLLKKLGFVSSFNDSDIQAFLREMANASITEHSVNPTAKPLFSRASKNTETKIPAQQKSIEILKTIYDKAAGRLAEARPAMLAAMGLRQITSTYKNLFDREGGSNPLKDYSNLVDELSSEKINRMTVADKLAKRWRRFTDEEKKDIADLMHESTFHQLYMMQDEEGRPLSPFEQFLKRSDDSAEEQFKRQRTYHQMKKKWEALPKEAKQLYQDVADHYQNHYNDLVQAMKDKIQAMKSRVDEEIASIDEKIKELRQEVEDSEGRTRQKKLSQIRRLTKQKGDKPKQIHLLEERLERTFPSKLKGPYFPLQRFGDYAVSFMDAQGDRIVEFFERRSEQVERFKELEKLEEAGKVLNPTHYKLADKNYIQDAASQGFVEDLFEIIDEQLPGNAGLDMKDAIGQLWLHSLPSKSARKAGIHRKNIKGYDADAMRAFAHSMWRGTNGLVKLKYGEDLINALDDMQDHIDDKRQKDKKYHTEQAQQIHDELVKRHEILINPSWNSISSALTSMGFFYFMGLSPAHFVINSLQTPSVTFPILAAKFGGKNTFDALIKGYTHMKAVEFEKDDRGKKDWTNLTVNLEKIDAKYRKAVEQAIDEGIIDTTNSHELISIAEGQAAQHNPTFAKIMTIAALPQHASEVQNRLVTFIAAYELASNKGNDADKSFEIAKDAVYDSHFDYSRANRPRIMEGNLNRVLFLFKQFSQNMSYLLIKNFNDSIRGETKERKKEARKILAGVLGTHALVAGSLGLPMVEFVGIAMEAIFSDEDDSWEWKTKYRNFLTDLLGENLEKVVSKGVLNSVTGADFASRANLSHLWFGYNSKPDTAVGEYQYLIENGLGPVFGMGMNVARGLDKWGKGKLWDGFNSMLPKALRDISKGYKYSDHGVVDSHGREIMSREELDAWDIFVQGFGFTPSELSARYDKRGAVRRKDQAIKDRSRYLVTRLTSAKIEGDHEAAKEWMREIKEFNSKHRSDGYTITMSRMDRALKRKQRQLRQAKQQKIYNFSSSNRRETLKEEVRFAG